MFLTRQSIWVAYVTVCYGASIPAALAQNFNLSWYSIDGGGAMFTTGGSFELSATIGQPDAGMMTGGNLTLTGGFWSVAPAGIPPVPGDCDDDGDVDLTDYGDFASCLAGPAAPPPSGCECSDFDADSEVDLRDFAGFQVVFVE